MNGYILQNLDLFLVGIVVSSTIVLGFSVYLNDPKSITNKTFFGFVLVTAIWGIVNYFVYQTNNTKLVLWLLRLIMFFAVWQAFTFFQLCFVFPKEKKIFSRIYVLLIIPLVILTSLITLTPLLFSKINEISEVGKVSNPDRGFGLFIFGFVAVGLVFFGFIILIKKIIYSSVPKVKRSLQLLLSGSIIMFILIIVFNFLIPVFINNRNFIPLSVIFVFPFIILTSYSILKHKLFNIKSARAGVLVFLLVVVSFSEIIFAKDLSLILYRIAIFFLILIFGIMLIRSVLKEVKMREELQKLYGDLKLADEKLKKLDEEKSEFLSIASHQLRTPMSVIKGYISMIMEGSFGKFEDKLKEVLNRIYISNERLVKLVDDLLDISRIERGKMIFSFKKQSFEKIIRDTVQELKPLAEQKKLKIVWEPENKNFPDVLIDENYMRQVILNLIDNAVKYSNKGIIAINLETKENGLLFSIKDNGIGISSDVMPFLFQRYSRGERVYTKAAEGMGLGLYVAKKIIDEHHGKIWAESEGEGHGATFFVELRVVK